MHSVWSTFSWERDENENENGSCEKDRRNERKGRPSFSWTVVALTALSHLFPVFHWSTPSMVRQVKILRPPVATEGASVCCSHFSVQLVSVGFKNILRQWSSLSELNSVSLAHGFEVWPLNGSIVAQRHWYKFGLHSLIVNFQSMLSFR